MKLTQLNLLGVILVAAAATSMPECRSLHGATNTMCQALGQDNTACRSARLEIETRCDQPHQSLGEAVKSRRRRKKEELKEGHTNGESTSATHGKVILAVKPRGGFDSSRFPVQLDSTSVSVGTSTLSGSSCDWINDCANPIAQKSDWTNPDGEYVGVSVVYNCFKRFPWGGKNTDSGVWLRDITKTSERCANTLTVKSPSQFKAQELDLKSTLPSLGCFSKQHTHMELRLKYRTGTGPWQPYINADGIFVFKCNAGDVFCSIPLQPALEATEVRLEMTCVGAYTSKGKVQSNGLKYLHFGFADAPALGKKVQLSVQLKTATTTFGWTPVVKNEVRAILSRSKEVNCTALLSSCILDSHWAQWKIPESGAFEQEPSVDEKPIKLEDTRGTKWVTTISKKRLVTPGESVIEKRMICLQTASEPKKCCVAKQLLEILSNTTRAKAVAQARLENF